MNTFSFIRIHKTKIIKSIIICENNCMSEFSLQSFVLSEKAIYFHENEKYSSI